MSGSSAATCATIGKITLPELKSRGYPDDIAMGSLAGAGTFGLLIPPSIIMIVYAVATDVSIAKLFVAGVLPGILLMAIFSAYLMLKGWSLIGDALSHSVVPGVAGAYILGLPFALGAEGRRAFHPQRPLHHLARAALLFGATFLF